MVFHIFIVSHMQNNEDMVQINIVITELKMNRYPLVKV